MDKGCILGFGDMTVQVEKANSGPISSIGPIAVFTLRYETRNSCKMKPVLSLVPKEIHAVL
jgi:hypothetical protein